VRERGSILVYAILAIVLLAAAGFLVQRVTSYLKGLDQQGYDRGALKVKSDYEARDNAALAKANDRIAALSKQVGEQEKAHADRVAKIDADKSKELNNVKAKAASDVARIRAGALRLRDPGRPEPGCPDGGGSPASPPVAGAGVGDGERGSELSRAAAAFLRSEAGRADAVVVKLTACQGIVESDRSQAR